MELFVETVCEVDSLQSVTKLLTRRQLRPVIISISYYSTLNGHPGSKTGTFVYEF
jgi:hypothetical protein